ncbi:hypothetical protein H072_9869 [Dactylellina haptotyla CBS 200.50]|uniref:Protein kinase domain-containing protein n=1 Tax=Dactylellina haptotyla (strain CBS 200.50) TaxID=1284197 RepID=S8BN21_DACHA|nr:hypothetical protein H072_9869 [Dactylellina haptotyla CBS 200.50]
MATETQLPRSQVQRPRAYVRLDDDAFAKQLLELFGTSTEAGRLAEPLLPDQEVTVAQYVRQHLSYTVYLLSLGYEESPNLGYIVIPVARHLMTDQYLRCNYQRLEQVPNFPKGLIARLEQLDRDSWFSEPSFGSHIVFDHQQSNGGDVPPPVSSVSTSPYSSGDRIDLAKISTNEAPLSGQSHARIQIEPMMHLVPGGKYFRRTEVLRLLAKTMLNVEDGGLLAQPIMQHFSLPAYTYTYKEKSYMLLSPEIIADANPEDSSHHVCTLAQFITCRPDWWLALSKEEKRARIFEWMTCLAAVVQFFHSLKVSHGDIQTKRIYIVRNGKDIQIFLEGWYQSHMDPRIIELSKKRPGLKSNKSFGYGMPVQEPTNSESRPPSRSKGSAPDLSLADVSRLHDVKCLGEIFAELLLVLLGLTKDSLSRQRRERLEWMKDMKTREGTGSWNPIFYPKPNTSASETSASSVASEMIEINIPRPGTDQSVSNGQQPSVPKLKVTESPDKPPKTANGKDAPSRPSSIFGGMFSKSKDAPKVVEPEPPKPAKSRMSYGIANKMASLSSSSGPPPPTWWLDELKLMYPAFQGATDNVSWNKHSDLIGNHLLLLISAMSVSEAALRPRAEAVWKDLTRIVSVFFKGTKLCCSAHDEQLKDSRETLRVNLLDDIYQRGIADEEEEAWEGIGWDGPERFGPKQIGRRGEGALGECLFD